jgi:hypothetical protein
MDFVELPPPLAHRAVMFGAGQNSALLVIDNEVLAHNFV